MKRVFLLLFSLWGGVAAADTHTPYALGERLHYQAYALGFIPIGTVQVTGSTGTFEGIPTYHFTGRCYGDYLVYLADVRVSSHLCRETHHSLFHEIQQYGTERRARQLRFNRDEDTLTYTRLEKDGVYRERSTVPMGPDVWDIFGAAFYYRTHFPTNVGEYLDIKIVEITRMFHLRFKVVEKRPFSLRGLGTCEAIRIEMSALNLEPDEIFSGLLELDRDVELWIETSTRTPIYLKTTVPFGIVRPSISVRLREWHAVPGFIPYFSRGAGATVIDGYAL